MGRVTTLERLMLEYTRPSVVAVVQEATKKLMGG